MYQPGILGNTLASTTLNPWTPRTLKFVSSTAIGLVLDELLQIRLRADVGARPVLIERTVQRDLVVKHLSRELHALVNSLQVLIRSSVVSGASVEAVHCDSRHFPGVCAGKVHGTGGVSRAGLECDPGPVLLVLERIVRVVRIITLEVGRGTRDQEIRVRRPVVLTRSRRLLEDSDGDTVRGVRAAVNGCVTGLPLLKARVWRVVAESTVFGDEKVRGGFADRRHLVTVLQVLPNARKVLDHVNAKAFQLLPRANAAKLEKLGPSLTRRSSVARVCCVKALTLKEVNSRGTRGAAVGVVEVDFCYESLKCDVEMMLPVAVGIDRIGNRQDKVARSNESRLGRPEFRSSRRTPARPLSCDAWHFIDHTFPIAVAADRMSERSFWSSTTKLKLEDIHTSPTAQSRISCCQGPRNHLRLGSEDTSNRPRTDRCCMAGTCGVTSLPESEPASMRSTLKPASARRDARGPPLNRFILCLIVEPIFHSLSVGTGCVCMYIFSWLVIGLESLQDRSAGDSQGAKQAQRMPQQHGEGVVQKNVIPSTDAATVERADHSISGCKRSADSRATTSQLQQDVSVLLSSVSE
ncbi:GMC oxidoreductase [Hortaea werneckii]|nr:GMC oxidoreductase [Hortaea werneckii]